MTESLQLLSSMAPRDAVAAAVDLYGRVSADSATSINVRALGGVEVAQRVAAGEAVDIIVLARAAIDRLTSRACLIATSCTDVMQSETAVAVRRGARHPVIATEADLVAAVKHAASLAYSTGPSGEYLESLFERWGLSGTLSSRAVVPPPGVPVAQLLSQGDVELGFQQLSEMLHAPGIEVVGGLPASIRHLTTFTAAITTSSHKPAAARRFIDFLASPQTSSLKQRYGMQPMPT